MDQAITIGREFGSGGREIGLLLAERLKVPFYDKELISMAAEQGGLAPDFVANHEEVSTSMFSTAIVSHSVFTVYQQPVSDQIFLAQSRVIRELSGRGPCVIVGRCADYILRESAIRIFIYADMEDRIQRKQGMETGVDDKLMEKHIRSIDKKRRRYYEYYTSQTWGDPKNYHLCINTSGVSISGAVDTILAYLSPA